MKAYIITIEVESEDDTQPKVKTLGGDVIFIALTEGQYAEWEIREVKDA